MYIIEFFNHAAAKGETVFAGTRAAAIEFLGYESNTLLTPAMQTRADAFREYVFHIPVPQDDIVWNVEPEESGAYYVFSKTLGKRAKAFADQ
jgi:hypothetical protein